MTALHWQAVAVLVLAAGAGTVLAILGPRGARRIADTAGSARSKLMGFLVLVTVLVAASWAPKSVPALPTVIAGLAAVGLWETVRAGRRSGSPAGVTLAAVLGFELLAAAALTWRAWPHDVHGLVYSFVIMTVMAGDAYAQLFGERVGRRQLAPRLSPNKTAEGLAAGLVAAAVLGAALGPTIIGSSPAGAVPLALHLPLDPLVAGAVAGALLGAALGAVGVVGDLVASALKRTAGLETFSGVLGAQGGVMDRFDSLFAALVVVGLLALLG